MLEDIFYFAVMLQYVEAYVCSNAAKVSRKCYVVDA